MCVLIKKIIEFIKMKILKNIAKSTARKSKKISEKIYEKRTLKGLQRI